MVVWVGAFEFYPVDDWRFWVSNITQLWAFTLIVIVSFIAPTLDNWSLVIFNWVTKQFFKLAFILVTLSAIVRLADKASPWLLFALPWSVLFVAWFVDHSKSTAT